MLLEALILQLFPSIPLSQKSLIIWQMYKKKCLIGTVAALEQVPIRLNQRRYPAQIACHDHAGLNLNAMISIAPEDLLLSMAAELDTESEQGDSRGLLHGVPMVVKDAIYTHPDLGLGTTVGNCVLVDLKPAKSASVVEKLIEQGVTIIGKANLNAFCNFKREETANGWSAVGGQTTSAYVDGGVKHYDGQMENLNPYGSSTGSAVGVSARYSPVASGTEIGGSLLRLAGRAALYALKPTVGNVHTEGVWTLSKTFDVVRAIAKSTADLAVVIEPLLQESVRQILPKDGFVSSLAGEFKGLRIGFLSPKEWHFPPQGPKAGGERYGTNEQDVHGRDDQDRRGRSVHTTPCIDFFAIGAVHR